MDLHQNECPCTVNEVETFDPIPKQVVLVASREVEYYSITSLANNSSVLEFQVEGTNDEYIDLNATQLVLDVKIVKPDDSDLIAADVIAPVNNWMHSMFSDIKMDIANTVIEGGEHLYPYKAYLYNLLSHDYLSKRTQLTGSGWYKDTHTAMNAVTNNTGATARQALVSRSKSIQLTGPILLDMMLQNRMLLPKTGFRLSFTRMKPEFQIGIYTAATVANRAQHVLVKIEAAKIIVRRVKAIASFIQQVEDNLVTQNADYPIQRTDMNTFTIPTGVTTFTSNDIFQGQLPKLVVVALVRNNAYSGAYAENPFNFKHFNLNSIELMDSSGTASFIISKPDFANNKYAYEYNSIFKALGAFNKTDSFDITPAEFGKGFAIYPFNLTPDLHIAGHQQITRNSTIRLNLGFSAATTEVVSVIVMGIFDGLVQISKARQVTCDWK